MMTYNNKEKTEAFNYETQLAILNVNRCIAFVASLDINSKTDYEFEQLIYEHQRLKNLREDLVFAIDNELSVDVAKDDYFLVMRWGRFNIEQYKRYVLNKGEFLFYHG